MVAIDTLSAKNPRAIGKALSVVERGGTEAEDLMAALRGRPRVAHTVGITGPPGVGKSTLVQALGLELVKEGWSVAVLAVDPSSPFTGGALLGDRVRMPEFVMAGGFVRSMATRGALGGLTAATSDAIDVLVAAEFEWVLVETVGVGQDEVDVAGEVETVVVVTTSGLGDDVQAAKAGVMEIGQVFVVNKADQPGADQQIAAIEGMLALAPAMSWTPPVIATSATKADGIDRLLTTIHEHQSFLRETNRRGELHRQRAQRRIERLLGAMVVERAREKTEAFFSLVEKVAEGRVDPYAAARSLLAEFYREER